MRDPKHPRKFTEEFKRQIVALYDGGKPAAEIMREYDLRQVDVPRWAGSSSTRPASPARRTTARPRSRGCSSSSARTRGCGWRSMF